MFCFSGDCAARTSGNRTRSSSGSSRQHASRYPPHSFGDSMHRPGERTESLRSARTPVSCEDRLPDLSQILRLALLHHDHHEDFQGCAVLRPICSSFSSLAAHGGTTESLKLLGTQRKRNSLYLTLFNY